MKIKQILMAILLVALSVVAVAAECTDAQTKTFEKWDQDWTKYNAEGNRAELEKIYADDYRAIGYLKLGNNDKKTIIDNAVKNVGSNPNVKSSSHNYVIFCTPNTVTISHRNTNIVTADGKETTYYSRTTHVLEKRSGNWQVVTSINQFLADDNSVIASTEIDSDQAFMKRDLEWFKKYYADDFVGTTGNGTSYDKKQMIAFLENLWKNDKTKWEFMRISDVDIRVDGNMGVMTGVRHSKGIGTDGKPFDTKSRFTKTLVKRDGKWMRIAAADTEVKESEAK